jgi:electron transfer flavoprotein beta subunit
MDIVACIKQVPDTSAADDIRIDASGKDIERHALTFKINDWDEYVLETGTQLKEKQGGTFTAITAGPKSWDDILRRALAVGADQAIRIDEDVVSLEPYIVARILAKAIQGLSYDLILFGAQSEDFGSGQLGAMVAEMLGIPHATLVVSLETEDKTAHIRRELEAGVLESYSIELPALLTIHTGINHPRYISLAAIKRAMKTELKVMSLKELGLSLNDLPSGLRLEKLELSPRGKEAEILSGSPEEAAEKLVRILRNSGIF